MDNALIMPLVWYGGALPDRHTAAYTFDMAATTITLDTGVRDRLAQRARRSGRSAGDEVRQHELLAAGHAATDPRA